MINFNSQICTTREQSKRLLDLGLKKETADMYYPNGIQDSEHIIRAIYPAFWESDTKIDAFIKGRVTPAWSLHRLMEMIPFNLKDKKGYIYGFVIEDDNTISYYYFAEQFWHCHKYWGKSNLYDNFIDCIEWLIKEGYFNKEYLEELCGKH